MGLRRLSSHSDTVRVIRTLLSEHSSESADGSYCLVDWHLVRLVGREGKGKGVSAQAMKAYRGMSYMASLILYFDPSWRSLVSFTP